MKDAIVQFLQSITGSPALTVFIFSMLPMVELKGAIPIGEALGFGLLKSAALAFLGSTFICIPIYFLLVPIIKLLKKIKFVSRLADGVEGVLQRRAEKLSVNADGKAKLKRQLLFAIYAFVALPLPLTGVWMGTAIAVFLGLKFKEVILPIALGNLTAGCIITLITYLFRDYVEYIILGLFAIAIIMLVIFIVQIALSKPRKEDTKNNL